MCDIEKNETWCKFEDILHDLVEMNPLDVDRYRSRPIGDCFAYEVHRARLYGIGDDHTSVDPRLIGDKNSRTAGM